jgi:pimeloyl-ACP methyl ester carboxylesterase
VSFGWKPDAQHSEKDLTCVALPLSLRPLLLLALLWFAVPLGANPGIWHFRFYGATPEALVKGRFAYFASFPKTATEFADLAKTKLAIPVLALSGEKSLGEALGAQARLVASDVSVIVLKNTGHWILEEQPAETIAALSRFLN